MIRLNLMQLVSGGTAEMGVRGTNANGNAMIANLNIGVNGN